jgi:hypothetical protein
MLKQNFHEAIITFICGAFYRVGLSEWNFCVMDWPDLTAGTFDSFLLSPRIPALPCSLFAPSDRFGTILPWVSQAELRLVCTLIPLPFTPLNDPRG